MNINFQKLKKRIDHERSGRVTANAVRSRCEFHMFCCPLILVKCIPTSVISVTTYNKTRAIIALKSMTMQ